MRHEECACSRGSSVQLGFGVDEVAVLKLVQKAIGNSWTKPPLTSVVLWVCTTTSDNRSSSILSHAMGCEVAGSTSSFEDQPKPTCVTMTASRTCWVHVFWSVSSLNP